MNNFETVVKDMKITLMYQVTAHYRMTGEYMIDLHYFKRNI